MNNLPKVSTHFNGCLQGAKANAVEAKLHWENNMKSKVKDTCDFWEPNWVTRLVTSIEDKRGIGPILEYIWHVAILTLLLLFIIWVIAW